MGRRRLRYAPLPLAGQGKLGIAGADQQKQQREKKDGFGDDVHLLRIHSRPGQRESEINTAKARSEHKSQILLRKLTK